MDCPARYVNAIGMQRTDAFGILDRTIGKMIWKSDEAVLDLGCGPGDVTADIIYPAIRNKIGKLTGADVCRRMVKYANETYGNSRMDFKTLDIEIADECALYAGRYDKIFSFYRLLWVRNKLDALVNMHTMLKSRGEILIQFLLDNPIVELYKFMDAEWQTYVQDVIQNPQNSYSLEAMNDFFTRAGFKIVNIESSIKTYIFPDFQTLLDAIKAVDIMYNLLPPDLHDRYSEHVKDKICEKQLVNICSSTGITTNKYLPIIVHAIKD